MLGGDGYELEFAEKVVGNRSPVDSPLMDAIRGWVGARGPGARVVPTMLPAFTDSRSFRDAFPECVAYGFFPQRADEDLRDLAAHPRARTSASTCATSAPRRASTAT